MCDERERLIGYVYDECDAGERRLVEAHLEACETCREEIGGLRGVRTDLLAWDVPDHGSVWTPFVKPRPVAWWREVPAWAMAAAATLTFLVGAAGGVATRAWLPPAAAPAGQAAVRSTGAVAVPAGVSRQDLSAMEHRVMSTMRAEMAQRVSLVSAHAAGDGDAALMRRVADLLEQSEQRQFEGVKAVNRDLYNVRIGTGAEIADLQAQVNQLKDQLSKSQSISR